MFWGDAAVCATDLRNRSPYHAIEENTPHEYLLFVHLILFRNIKVFGSTCYALIKKEQRKKLVARSRRFIFLRYSDACKEYHLYDEVNKKLVVSRDVIYLKTKRQLDRLEKFSHLKTYYEFDNEIPNLEGGMLVLDQDQTLEFHFEAPTPLINSIERKLDRLEKVSHQKTDYEFDNEIPNLEGGILILDQDHTLEFPFEAPTPLVKKLVKNCIPPLHLNWMMLLKGLED